MFVISKENWYERTGKHNDVYPDKPLFIWLKNTNDIGPGCLEQARNLSLLPFAFHHIALMPDTHQGYGMPIGGVLATKNVIVPNAVGVDIGCGMGFIETNVPVAALKGVKTGSGELLRAIIANIKRDVPVGFQKHDTARLHSVFDNYPGHIKIIADEIPNAKLSLGTLGGGNHFIELQENEDGRLCIMLHSGSRNFGLKIADYYDTKAKELNAKWFSSVEPKWDLAFLPVDDKLGMEYITAMDYALKFAAANREMMMDKVKNGVLSMIMKHTEFKDGKILAEVNIHHNYAALENHYGENVWVHRKGAIRMRDGELGIIPGSMGTPSYIVKGKGNEKSFMSASHGAGRCMGRKDAERRLNVEEQRELMKDVVMLNDVKSVIDECPGAYKNIDEVIENESDLVEVIMKLKPIANIKG